jgi:hypothetical protein
MTANFGDYQLLPIFVFSIGVIFVSTEIGRWLRMRAGDRGGEQVRTLKGAVLGLDDQERRLTAFRNHVPNIVLLSLYGVAAVAGTFSGYASGVGARSARLPIYAMIVLICAVILPILDLDRPSAGFIRTSQQPMIDTAAAIANY